MMIVVLVQWKSSTASERSISYAIPFFHVCLFPCSSSKHLSVIIRGFTLGYFNEIEKKSLFYILSFSADCWTALLDCKVCREMLITDPQILKNLQLKSYFPFSVVKKHSVSCFGLISVDLLPMPISNDYLLFSAGFEGCCCYQWFHTVCAVKCCPVPHKKIHIHQRRHFYHLLCFHACLLQLRWKANVMLKIFSRKMSSFL